MEICEECGKEFEQRSGVGGLRRYCSLKCRNARNNRKFRNNKAKKLGMDYWSWKWRNDATFKEKKKEYNRKHYRSLTERRHDEKKGE